MSHLTPEQILANARMQIAEYAADDPDKWFYCNRFVFARLGLDERKTKAAIKKALIKAKSSCHHCGVPFDDTVNIHLHRLDGARGYSDSNCVLMHALCHREHHADKTSSGRNVQAGEVVTARRIISKVSKRYFEEYFTYWWDIGPGLCERLNKAELMEFIKKDTEEGYVVETAVLIQLLTPENQTSRGHGNWGVRVFANENFLRLELRGSREAWPVIPSVRRASASSNG